MKSNGFFPFHAGYLPENNRFARSYGVFEREQSGNTGCKNSYATDKNSYSRAKRKINHPQSEFFDGYDRIFRHYSYICQKIK
jgi:hypothetical protein